MRRIHLSLSLSLPLPLLTIALSSTSLVEMSISPQSTSTLKGQDSDHTFSVRLPIQNTPALQAKFSTKFCNVFVHIVFTYLVRRCACPTKIICCIEEGIFSTLCSSSIHMKPNTYMLFTGREVRIGENCARGLDHEYGPRPQAEGHTQVRGHSFSQYGPT